MLFKKSVRMTNLKQMLKNHSKYLVGSANEVEVPPVTG